MEADKPIPTLEGAWDLRDTRMTRTYYILVQIDIVLGI